MKIELFLYFREWMGKIIFVPAAAAVSVMHGLLINHAFLILSAYNTSQ